MKFKRFCVKIEFMCVYLEFMIDLYLNNFYNIQANLFQRSLSLEDGELSRR